MRRPCSRWACMCLVRSTLLARLARPTIGVVTAVRGVHLSRAGSIDAIEAGKRELVEALPAGGAAVLNADDARVVAMAARTRRQRCCATASMRPLTCTPTTSAPWACEAWPSAAAARRQRGRSPRRRWVATRVHNALAAAAVGACRGPGCRDHRAGPGARLPRAPPDGAGDAGPWTILDDTYNASPDAVAWQPWSLLADAARTPRRGAGRDARAGRTAAAGHLAVGRRRRGPRGSPRRRGRGRGGHRGGRRGRRTAGRAHRAGRDRADAALARWRALRDGDTILVKASRGAALDRWSTTSCACSTAAGATRMNGDEAIVQGILLAFASSSSSCPRSSACVRRLGMGKRIRVDGPQSHYIKEGTPTLGGLLIIGVVLGVAPGGALITAPTSSTAPRSRRSPRWRSWARWARRTTGSTRAPATASGDAEAAVADRGGRRGGLADPGDVRHHGRRRALRRRREHPARRCTSCSLPSPSWPPATASTSPTASTAWPAARSSSRSSGFMVIAAAASTQPGGVAAAVPNLRRAVRAHHRRAAGLPVVQRPPGPDLHGRLGCPGPGRHAGRRRAHHRPGPAAAAHRHRLRARDRSGHHPDRLLQADAASASSGWRRCTTTSS